MGIAFWAHNGASNKHKTQNSDSKNFINKVRNNTVVNKKYGSGRNSVHY
jgi:hypothetical protein